MKSLRIIFFLSAIILLGGCRKKEFSISFDVEKSLNANYKLIYYASDKRGGFITESAVALNGGKGEFKGPVINPVLVYLFAGNRDYPLMIYAERGEEIKVSGDSRNPSDWKVEGNTINEAWSSWRNENAKALDEGNGEEINKAIEKYVKKNPENPLSTLLLLTGFSRIKDEKKFLELWKILKGEARDPKWTGLVGRADMPDNFTRMPGPLKNMALRSIHNGVDTIRPSDAKATLLYFWSQSDSDRKEFTDSLKKLSKEFPDSSKRIIADICIDSDSTSWRSTIRQDSMKNVVRMWTPMGLADDRLIGLSVTRIPFFLVVSPDGKQIYRGDKLSEAFKEFRKSFNSN